MAAEQAIAAAALVIVSCAGMTAVVSAQASGTVTGVVTDKSGAWLPGVTVALASPSLVEKARTAVTDGAGQYRIENLPTGVYSATFSLSGFSTVQRNGVEVAAGSVANVNTDMSVLEPPSRHVASPFDRAAARRRARVGLLETVTIIDVRPRVTNPAAQIQRPRIICDLTVLPADRSVDPKIHVPTFRNGVEQSMRTVVPSVCRDE